MNKKQTIFSVIVLLCTTLIMGCSNPIKSAKNYSSDASYIENHMAIGKVLKKYDGVDNYKWEVVTNEEGLKIVTLSFEVDIRQFYTPLELDKDENVFNRTNFAMEEVLGGVTYLTASITDITNAKALRLTKSPRSLEDNYMGYDLDKSFVKAYIEFHPTDENRYVPYNNYYDTTLYIPELEEPEFSYRKLVSDNVYFIELILRDFPIQYGY